MLRSSPTLRWLGVIALLLVFGGLALAPIHFQHRTLTRNLFDATHQPMMVVVTLALFGALHRLERHFFWRCAVVAVVGTAFMAAIELGQSQTARSASWTDMRNGGIGIAIGLGALVLARLSRGRVAPTARGIALGLYALAVAALAVRGYWPALTEWRAIRLQESGYPVLSGFEQSYEISRWHPHGKLRIERVRDHAAAGEWALRVEASPLGRLGFSVANPDWRRVSRLEADLFNPGEAFGLRVRVNGEESAPAVGVHEAPPGWSTIALPLAGTALDRSRVDSVAFEVERRGPDGAVYFLDQVRVAEDGESVHTPAATSAAGPKPLTR